MTAFAVSGRIDYGRKVRKNVNRNDYCFVHFGIYGSHAAYS